MTDRDVWWWEALGTTAGFGCCLAILVQLIEVLRTGATGGISVLGLWLYLGVFAFWTAYGWRFARRAIWLTNGTAALLQITLVAVVATR
jgi:uncharacterized protein with PQ loop repeat